MQASIAVSFLLDQLDQAGKGAFLVHHLKGGFIFPSIVNQKGGDEMQRCRAVLLQKNGGFSRELNRPSSGVRT